MSGSPGFTWTLVRSNHPTGEGAVINHNHLTGKVEVVTPRESVKRSLEFLFGPESTWARMRGEEAAAETLNEWLCRLDYYCDER